jgi:hypothetical protein
MVFKNRINRSIKADAKALPIFISESIVLRMWNLDRKGCPMVPGAASCPHVFIMP